MKNGLKTAALSFSIAVLFGSVVVGCAGTDTVEKSSESHHSETVTAAPGPAVVMVQPAPVIVAPAPAVVTQEHSSSNSAASESSPSGNSVSEKSSSSKSSTTY